MIKIFILPLAIILAGCVSMDESPDRIIAHLPEPVSNNAVAIVGDTAYSFAGLHMGKTWRDLSADAYACDLRHGTCRTIAPLPDGVGRLAATATTIGGKVYIFGGYSVAEDGAEKSTPEVWVFDPVSETYTRAANMPVPVDDSVALPFSDRYIYLVSGWHDNDNVDLVQVLDTRENRWFNATAFAGSPVFGHAGSMTGTTMVICDGVKVVPPASPGGKRSFVGAPQCWRGDVNPDDPASINWERLRALPPAYYRMASMVYGDKIIFSGGTDNPYNYDGIGYNGAPSKPARHVWAYDIGNGEFEVLQDMPWPGMDHRGAGRWHDQMIIIGGMGEGQNVLDTVRAFTPQPRQ